MKINREMVTRAGLKLLNEIGLEQLTLRKLGVELGVQAATIYWHFKSKEDLLDEMATTVFTEGAKYLLPKKRSADWTTWAKTYGNGLRTMLLEYRDGARMASGTRFTNTEPLKATEEIAGRMVEAGFTLREAVVLMTTIYNYAVCFVLEEQAVCPSPGERVAFYLPEARKAWLDPDVFPLHRQASAILFDGYDRRFREGLELILAGAEAKRK